MFTIRTTSRAGPGAGRPPWMCVPRCGETSIKERPPGCGESHAVQDFCPVAQVPGHMETTTWRQWHTFLVYIGAWSESDSRPRWRSQSRRRLHRGRKSGLQGLTVWTSVQCTRAWSWSLNTHWWYGRGNILEVPSISIPWKAITVSSDSMIFCS